MALAESSTRSAAGAAMGEWLQRIHPAWALVALILVIMPAIANGFVLVQIFGWSFMLGNDCAEPHVPGGIRRHG